MSGSYYIPHLYILYYSLCCVSLSLSLTYSRYANAHNLKSQIYFFFISRWTRKNNNNNTNSQLTTKKKHTIKINSPFACSLVLSFVLFISFTLALSLSLVFFSLWLCYHIHSLFSNFVFLLLLQLVLNIYIFELYSTARRASPIDAHTHTHTHKRIN